MVRTSMLEELSQDYIRSARAKRLPERTLVYHQRHLQPRLLPRPGLHPDDRLDLRCCEFCNRFALLDGQSPHPAVIL
jgi:hypothetical protein